MSGKPMVSRLVPGVALAALLSGCTAVDPGMGETLKYDMLAQTVNPDPVYSAGGAVAGDDGVHGQKATERYRKGTVKPIERMITSSSGSSSGGGSGSGAQ